MTMDKMPTKNRPAMTHYTQPRKPLTPRIEAKREKESLRIFKIGEDAQ